MKKILFVALAAVGLTACVQNEELAVSHDGKAISFDNVYVENATKAAIDGSYTHAKGNLDHFNVWATIGNNGESTNIFENLAVTKNGSAWTYDAALTQYWIPGNHYEFVGVVDGNVTVTTDACKMPVSIATNLSEQKDVLYATAERTYNNGDVVSPVHLQFEHLLAKAKFTAKNAISAGSNGLEYVVKSIKITNADDAAVYTIANDAWVASSTYEADFGVVTKTSAAENAEASRLAYGESAESNWEHLILPQEGKELHIVVDYKLYKDAVCVGNYTGTEMVATLDIAAGKAYNFVLSLGNPGEPITFTADVTDWVEENVPVYNGTVEVTSAEEFETAFVTPEVDVIVLSEDVVLGSVLTRAEADPSLIISAGKSITIDLNGHKLSATSSQSGNRDMFLVKGNLTIKNGTIEYQHVGENLGWSAMTTLFDITAGGVLNLEGVTAKNLGGSDMAFVAHLNNWGEATLNANNCVLESSYIAVRVFNSGYDMNNVTIKNSTLTANYGVWVHNYTVADFGTEDKAEAQKALLNFDIYENNTYNCTKAAVLYGFTNSIKESIVSTEEELAAAIAAGHQVVLIADIAVENPITIAQENNVVLQLNGHTISATDNATAGYALITNHGNLTIEGQGKLVVKATNNRGWNAYSSVISNSTNGVLVVNGGTIEHLGGTDMAYGIDILTNGGIGDAHCTINGGHIKSTYRAVRQFLNSDSKVNTLIVNGGVIEGANKSIWMQDPSKKSNKGVLTVAAEAQLKGDVYLYVTAGSEAWPVEVSIASAALVGESTVLTGNVPFGYEVVEENGAWVVVENVVANSNESLKEALAGDATVVAVAAGEYTFPAGSIKAGVTLQCAEGTVFTGTSSLNIKGATVVGATFKNEGGQAVSGTIYGNFKNCTFVGQETLRWCYTAAGETTVFENCVVKTTLRGIHFDVMDGDVIFKNCEINGFNAYSGSGNITFEGCTFGCDASGYNGLNIYSNTVLTNCNFVFLSNKTNFIDMEGTEKTLTITNCTATLDGAAADVKNFIGGSKLANNTVVVDGVTL